MSTDASQSGSGQSGSGRPWSGRPWSGRTHSELAHLTREFLLAGHLIDRSGMPHVISQLGPEEMTRVAIGEWMAASPNYTARMQRLLGFEGDTVATIFKGIQLDIGAPHEFLDFRFDVHDDHHGEFHLPHCGALMDVEPMGEDFVLAMCHDIEDPTFDATAIATNAKARVRPVHRPPRIPADQAPHCRWTVTIDEANDDLPIPEEAVRLAASAAARLALAEPDPSLATDDGWNDYAGAFDRDFVTERLSSAALSAVLDELALQGHLLARAYLLEVADRTSLEEARVIGVRQAAGVAGVTAKRLAALFGCGDGLDAVATVLTTHPLLMPRTYVPVDFEVTPERIVLSLRPGPGRDEDDGLSWPALLAGDGGTAVLEALVTCIDPQGGVERLDDTSGDVADEGTVRWSVTVDPDREPARQPSEVTLTEFSTGADFEFTRTG